VRGRSLSRLLGGTWAAGAAVRACSASPDPVLEELLSNLLLLLALFEQAAKQIVGERAATYQGHPGRPVPARAAPSRPSQSPARRPGAAKNKESRKKPQSKYDLLQKRSSSSWCLILSLL